MKQIEGVEKTIKGLVDLTNSQELGGSSLSGNLIKMPELALVMAKYFTSLGKYCLSFYNGYKDEQSKKMKKVKKQKRQSNGQLPPKKPVTAYISYYQQKVPLFQQKYPEYAISQLTRLIAKQWSDLPQQLKQPFQIKAANDRKRYERESRQFKVRNGKKDESDSSQLKKQQIIQDGQSESNSCEQQQRDLVSEQQQREGGI